MIPKTPAQVSEFAAQGKPFDLCLRNFLDYFYAHPNSAALQMEPQRLAALRAVFLVESPAPFRSRNLFVSENAQTRA